MKNTTLALLYVTLGLIASACNDDEPAVDPYVATERACKADGGRIFSLSGVADRCGVSGVLCVRKVGDSYTINGNAVDTSTCQPTLASQIWRVGDGENINVTAQ
jgi:hypothetical protein